MPVLSQELIKISNNKKTTTTKHTHTKKQTNKKKKYRAKAFVYNVYVIRFIAYVLRHK